MCNITQRTYLISRYTELLIIFRNFLLDNNLKNEFYFILKSRNLTKSTRMTSTKFIFYLFGTAETLMSPSMICCLALFTAFFSSLFKFFVTTPTPPSFRP